MGLENRKCFFLAVPFQIIEINVSGQFMHLIQVKAFSAQFSASYIILSRENVIICHNSYKISHNFLKISQKILPVRFV